MDMTHDPTQEDSAPVILKRGGRRWAFTLNNYDNFDLDSLTHEFKTGGATRWVIGKEVGEEGTPHLQGYVEFSNQRRLGTMKKIHERVHWEIAKKVREANFKYCTEDGDYIQHGFETKQLKTITELRPWQQDIEDLILTEPDDRKIYWFWEPNGNFGKTALIKYLLVKYNFIQFTRATKSADILTCADPKYSVYLFDFARCQEGFAPWIALEQLKDGLVSDSKLKKTTRNIIMNPPHIIIFANWEPERKLSKDRLCVTLLEQGPAIAD